MKYGISEIATIPVRKEPAEASEMLTQVLFGETFKILEEIPRWIRIRLDYDGQEGWIDWKMATLVSELWYKQSLTAPSAVVAERICTVTTKQEEVIPVSFGASLPFFDLKKKTFQIGDKHYNLNGKIFVHQDKLSFREELAALACSLRGASYLWGGKGAMALDCSGFTQILYKTIGIRLLRNAREQITQGKAIASLDATLPGDLVFFNHDGGNVSHVGMVLSANKVIHCSGIVRVDRLDTKGIFNADRDEYSHELCGIQRYLD